MSAPVKPPRGIPRQNSGLSILTSASADFFTPPPATRSRTPLRRIDDDTILETTSLSGSGYMELPRNKSKSPSSTTLRRRPVVESIMSTQTPTTPTPGSETKFSSTEKWTAMLDAFRFAVEQRGSSEFSGQDGTSIVEQYIYQRKEDFPMKNLGRENAVKVMESFMRQCVFSSIDGGTEFQDSKRVMYTLLHRDQFRLMPPTPCKETPSESAKKRPGSFKRFLRRSFNKSIRDITVTTRSQTASDNDSIYSQDSNEALSETDLEIYRAALFRLLTIIDVPYLDGVSNPQNSIKGRGGDEEVSLLSSILSKMGLFGREKRNNELFDEEETDDCIAENRVASNELLLFFNLARMICPSIRLRHEVDNPIHECSSWAAYCIREVCATYASLSRDGSAPLIPMEFSGLVQALVEQILLNDLRWKDEKRCLQYLVLMIPPVLRKHLITIVRWLNSAKNTRSYCVMGKMDNEVKGLYYKNITLSRQANGHRDISSPGPRPDINFDENYELVIHSVSDFVVPSTLGFRCQRLLIKGLVSLYEDRLIGILPTELEDDIQRGRENSIHDGVAQLNVRYCEERPAKEEDVTAQALVQMMSDMIANPKIKNSDKVGQMKRFQEAHPDVYERNFDGWLKRAKNL